MDENLKKFLFHRYIDDYVAFCESTSQADEFLQELEVQLAIYKLALNHRKTSFSDLPVPTATEWVLDIRKCTSALNLPLRPSAAVNFIDHALNLSRFHNDPNVMKYAFRVLAGQQRHYFADGAVLEYGLLLVDSYPAILSSLSAFIPHGVSTSGPLKIGEKLLRILDDGLLKRRTDQATWAMYFLNMMKYPIPDASIKACVTSLDCVSILVAFRYASKSQRTSILPLVERLIKAPDMHDRHRYWLLIYELYRCKYISSAGDDTGVFKILAAHNVRFMPSLIKI